MGDVRPVEPVVRFCAIISRYEEARQWAIERLADRWGAIELISETYPFTAGNYYERTMGSTLHKTLLGFRSVVDPEPLAEWKLASNQWESNCAAEINTREPRPLNLDPGYVTQAKLVLATTKDRDHRVYLRAGIFAEVTLSFTGGRWTHHRWTYPDYRTEPVRRFVDECRNYLREQLQSHPVRRQSH